MENERYYCLTPLPLWEHFDADKPNPRVEEFLRRSADEMLKEACVNQSRNEIRSFVEKQIERYKSGKNPSLNETIAMDIYRPEEFDVVSQNDSSLADLMRWLSAQCFDWRQGSEAVKRAISAKFPSGGSKKSEGGREYVVLDNLVEIGGKNAAIEVETSNNLDNGFFTLRQAVRTKMADYGMMVVPWSSEGKRRADEGKALGRLDRQFDGSTELRDGPIYRIAIIRRLDVCWWVLKQF
jgi:hypothetical protein